MPPIQYCHVCKMSYSKEDCYLLFFLLCTNLDDAAIFLTGIALYLGGRELKDRTGQCCLTTRKKRSVVLCTKNKIKIKNSSPRHQNSHLCQRCQTPQNTVSLSCLFFSCCVEDCRSPNLLHRVCGLFH